MWETEIVRKCLTPQILILLPSQLLIFFNLPSALLSFFSSDLLSFSLLILIQRPVASNK